MKTYSQDGKTKKKSGHGNHRNNGKAASKPKKSGGTSHKNSASYDQFKEFQGKRYTGMKIGRSHKWYYDQGEWKEKKVTPDKWEFVYTVKKRRAGKAPEGSGVPVGTEYHWFIVAHQNVKKLNANDYSTSMTGMKFKVAHKRADSDKWSASDRAQRKRLIQFLQETIRMLEQEPIDQAPAQQKAEKPNKATRPSKTRGSNSHHRAVPA